MEAPTSNLAEFLSFSLNVALNMRNFNIKVGITISLLEVYTLIIIRCYYRGSQKTEISRNTHVKPLLHGSQALMAAWKSKSSYLASQIFGGPKVLSPAQL